MIRRLAGKATAARTADGKIRTAEYRGATYMVVPVIALVEGVIQASNAASPELVLASEFGKKVQGWNGRPVMVGHPKSSDGQPISANDPRVLEASGVGLTFGSHVDGRQLQLEAWIDEAQARALGGDALDLVERLQADETVEVSVGVFLDLEARSGTHDGHEYAGVWANLVPDHLAMLRANEVGACSIQMGCGAPRAAERSGLVVEMWEGLKRSLGLRAAVTDVDRRRALEIALRDAEPSFYGIHAVEDDTRVIYEAWGEKGGISLFARDFSATKTGQITLKGERIEVRPNTTYVAAGAAATDTQPLSRAAACACGHNQPATGAQGAVMEKAARIAALIASKKNTFTAGHQAFLETLSEDQLKALEAADAAATEATAAQPAAPQAQQQAAQPATEAEYLANAPQSIKDIVEQHKAAQAARKTELVASLKAAQKKVSEADLNAMSLAELERLNAIVAEVKGTPVAAAAASGQGGLLSFAGLGVPRAAAGESAEKIGPPPSLEDAVRAARGVVKAS